MKLGEVCLLTSDVVRLADFYRKLLEAEDGEDKDDLMHQFVLVKETDLTIMKDDAPRKGQSAVLTFTVEDIYAAHARLQEMGVKIVEPPTARPWGAVNMSFLDPDGNVVYFRTFPRNGE
ncbi:VOC family protein [Acutalibacter caecimuris]|uniref:VOC family protein n=1 Tax=Acutalibacter caecimuris TaxID=3093657 RepID=UPI002AC925D6|nr:VOC family protein [Acutalibacter sp. M00118]